MTVFTQLLLFIHTTEMPQLKRIQSNKNIWVQNAKFCLLQKRYMYRPSPLILRLTKMRNRKLVVYSYNYHSKAWDIVLNVTLQSDCPILRGPVGERIVDVVPGGTELERQLRRGVGQAVHARNNSHVQWTGVYCAQTVNNADTNELCWVQFSGSWILSLTLTLISSFIKSCWSPFEILLQTATGTQGSYCYVRQPTHC
jgi:hypothetical protein